uniref:Uncharacterized protein n=1 Tax=Aegilops tauschii subsp. strangulata TaxID=200361 RepID=A0A452YHV2_AEGTS
AVSALLSPSLPTSPPPPPLPPSPSPTSSGVGQQAAMASPARIDVDKLSVEQLKALKEQTDLEVNLLQDSLSKIRTAATRLENATAALHELSLRPQGTAHPILTPSSPQRSIFLAFPRGFG